jgi:hypothetical protein
VRPVVRSLNLREELVGFLAGGGFGFELDGCADGDGLLYAVVHVAEDPDIRTTFAGFTNDAALLVARALHLRPRFI